MLHFRFFRNCRFRPAASRASRLGLLWTGLFAFSLLIVYLTRKSAIGGWLFYYYYSVYWSLFPGLIRYAVFFSNLNPSLWQNQTQYVISAGARVVESVALIGSGVLSTMLLFRKCRSPANLFLLNKFLLATLIMFFVSLTLDYIHPPGWIAFDIANLIGSAVRYLYIVRSRRVQHVFLLQDFKAWYTISHAVKQMSSANIGELYEEKKK